MNVSLIGMSGVGKSKITNEFAEAGWEIHDIDATIANWVRDDRDYPKDPELKPVKALAAWMGRPWDAKYKARCARYRELEDDAVQQAINKIRASAATQNLIDTTGSVIYLPFGTRSLLRTYTEVVYLSAETAPERAELKRRLIEKPKPIIWDDAYRPKPHESREDSLSRCFDEYLLPEREERYRALAHFVFEREIAVEALTHQYLQQRFEVA